MMTFFVEDVKSAQFMGKVVSSKFRCGSRIWSGRGPQLLRPKVADVAKRSCASEVSNLRLGSRALERALEAFGFLMLKYAFSHILETLFSHFWHLFSHQKLIKIEHKNLLQSIWDILIYYTYFLIFLKKLCFNWMTWSMPSEARLKNFMTWKIDQLCDW